MTEFSSQLIAQAIVLTFASYGSSPFACATVHLFTPLVPFLVRRWRRRGVSTGEAPAIPISRASFAPRAFALTLILPVLLFAFNLLRAAYQDSQTRTAQIETLRQELLETRGDRDEALSTANTLEARREAAAAQIDLNQAATAQCLVELGRAQQEDPLRLAVYSLPSSPPPIVDRQNKQGGPPFERVFIVDTNRDISPVRLLVKCSERLLSVDAYALGATMPICDAWTGPKPDGAYGVGISSPVWAAMSPMLVMVRSTDGDPQGCGFSVL